MKKKKDDQSMTHTSKEKGQKKWAVLNLIAVQMERKKIERQIHTHTHTSLQIHKRQKTC